MKKWVIILVMVVVLVCTASECDEATKVSYNVSKQADNFNVTRRLTVINTRTDKCILQMVGKMSIEDQTDGIAVLVELDRENKVYQKHYIYMNQWTMYTVEDINGVSVSNYSYEFEFMPQNLTAIKIRTDEVKEEMGVLNEDTNEDE